MEIDAIRESVLEKKLERLSERVEQLTVGSRSHELTADEKLNMIIARIDQLD